MARCSMPPFAIAVDSSGALYVSDQLNSTIHKGVFSAFVPANPVAFSPTLTNGQLNVTLLPPQAGGQWRFGSGNERGAPSGKLCGRRIWLKGEYAVEFRSIPGYLAIPLSGPVAVTNGGTTYLTSTLLSHRRSVGHHQWRWLPYDQYRPQPAQRRRLAISWRHRFFLSARIYDQSLERNLFDPIRAGGQVHHAGHAVGAGATGGSDRAGGDLSLRHFASVGSKFAGAGSVCRDH